MKSALHLTLLICTFFTSSAVAGPGFFDSNDNLTLFVYLPKRVDEAELQSTVIPYFQRFAGSYYDALEGKSRVKDIWIYNGLSEGNALSDVKILTGEFEKDSAWANLDSLGQRSGVVGLGEAYLSDLRPSAGRTLVHELGHYIWGLRDCYGGMLTSGNVTVPVPWLKSANIPSGTNYRNYMWSDDFLRFFAAEIDPSSIPLPESGSQKARIFYERGGGAIAGTLNLFDEAVSMMDSQGREFSTAASAVRGQTVRVRLPAYPYGPGGRRQWPADAGLKTYNTFNHQWFIHGLSEWNVIAGRMGWTLPSVPLVAQPAPIAPTIRVIDNRGTALCIDASGSMGGAPIRLAKLAATGIVQLTPSEEGQESRVAIVSFSNAATVVSASTDVSDAATRRQVETAISAISATSSTNVTAGLTSSRLQLTGVIEPDSYLKSCILLSDGEHNVGAGPLTVLPGFVSDRIALHTIALGDADRALLAQLSEETAGKAFVVNSEEDLPRIFQEIFAMEAGSGNLSRDTEVWLGPGKSISRSFSIHPGASRASFSAISSGTYIGASLRRPDRRLVVAGDPDVQIRGRGALRTFVVTNPMAGDWTLSLDRRPQRRSGPWNRTEVGPPSIPKGGTLTSSLAVGSSGTVAGLKLTLFLLHPAVQDLRVELVAPDGGRVLLQNRGSNVFSGRNTVYGVGSNVSSVQSLSALDGMPLDGTWTLEISDLGTRGGGAFAAWSMESTGEVFDTSGLDRISLATVVEDPSIRVAVDAFPSSAIFAEPVYLTASVSDGNPVLEADVRAVVSMPDGSNTEVRLLDDGGEASGDSQEGDGIYTASYDDFGGGDGIYDFRITASTTATSYTLDRTIESTAVARPARRFSRSSSVQANVTGVPAAYRFPVTLSQFSVTDSSASKGDSFSASGFFLSTAKDILRVADSKVRFHVAGADYWFNRLYRLGRSNRFVANGFNGEGIMMNYYVGGSSKSTFAIRWQRHDLLSNPAAVGGLVPFGIRWGATTNYEWLNWYTTVRAESNGATFRYGSSTLIPEFMVLAMSASINDQKRFSDRLTFTARLTGPSITLPSERSFVIDVAGFVLEIPKGTMSATRSGTFQWQETNSDGTESQVVFNPETGILNVSVRNAWLESFRKSSTANVYFSVEEVPDSWWYYRVGLTADSKRRNFRL